MTNHMVHSSPTRIAHWANAAVVLLLLSTGFSFFAAQHHVALPHVLSRHARFTLHVIAGSAFALNGVLYVTYLLRSRGWQRLLLGLPASFGPLSYRFEQRASYVGAFGLASAMAVTGIALWLRRPLPWFVTALGGPHVALTLHLAAASLMLLFLIAHGTQVVRAGAATLASMTGDALLRRSETALSVPVHCVDGYADCKPDRETQPSRQLKPKDQIRA